MSGNIYISNDNHRILFCINGYTSYHKDSNYKMILYPLLYKEDEGKDLAHKYLNKVLDKIAEYRV